MRGTFLKQQEVIELLNAGWEIFTTRIRHLGLRGQTVYDSLRFIICKLDGEKKIHHQTIKALQNKKIIDRRYRLIKRKK